MPPVSKWLKRELSKVKLPAAAQLLQLPAETLTRDLSKASLSKASLRSEASSQDRVERERAEELAHACFIRAQFQGSLLRGNFEEEFQERARRTRELALEKRQEESDRRSRQRRAAKSHRLRVERKRAAVELRAESSESSAAPGDDGSGSASFSAEEWQCEEAAGPLIDRLGEPEDRQGFHDRRRSAERMDRLNRLRQQLRRRVSQEAVNLAEEHTQLLAEIAAMHHDHRHDEEQEENMATAREAFVRYDKEGSGKVDVVRAKDAFSDLGLRPEMGPEKQAIGQLLQDALRNRNGLSFQDFVALMPRVREAIRETKRPELEKYYHRCVETSESCRFELKHFKPCLRALGSNVINIEAEWSAVSRLFQDSEFARVSKPKADVKRRKTRVAQGRPLGLGFFGAFGGVAAKLAVPLEKEVCPEEQRADQLRHFDAFEDLFHEAQIWLTAVRREKERCIAEELRIGERAFAEFRADLLEFEALFLKYDADSSGSLDLAEISQLLAECGCPQRFFAEAEQLGRLLMRAKLEARASFHGETTVLKKTLGNTARRVSAALGMIIRPPASNMPAMNADECKHVIEGDSCTFAEFLMLMRLIRTQSRAAHRDLLQDLFQKYDTDASGEITVSEMHKVFRDLRLQPKTREEQLEIRSLLDEVDHDGSHSFEFAEFEVLVERTHERLQRAARIEEEKFALEELKFTQERCKELRQVFQAVAPPILPGQDSIPRLLGMHELRLAMNKMEKRCKSEILLELFWTFSRETESGGLDSRAFLKMMHAIEIARTHRLEVPKRTCFFSQAPLAEKASPPKGAGGSRRPSPSLPPASQEEEQEAAK